MVKKILYLLFLLSPAFVFAQQKGLSHQLEMGIAYSFKPSEKFVRKAYQHGDIIYGRYKKYTYPSLRVRYLVTKKLNRKLDAGLESGITFRYQEPWWNGSYTYYSFPLALNATYQILKTKKERLLFSSAHLGYHFKHPKYKVNDGMGGAIASIDFGMRNKAGSASYKLGYEAQQDNYLLNYSSTSLSSPAPYFIKFYQIVSQVYLSVMIKIK